MRTTGTTAAESIVDEFAADRSRLLDIVEAVQRRSGYVSEAAVQAIARGLGIHPVEVEDMLSFYAFFDRQPRGHNRIRLSKTPISFIKGAKAVAHAFEQALGIAVGGTSADGVFTLQWTSDIGMADQEPSALINGMILTALTPGDVPQIVAALRREGRFRRTQPYEDRAWCSLGRSCRGWPAAAPGSRRPWLCRPIR